MREEFLEPLPTPRKPTRSCLMGKTTQVVCVIVEVTADGFRVAVPGVEQYAGDPENNGDHAQRVYPVRLVLQGAHIGGYSLPIAADRNRTSCRWMVHRGFSDRFEARRIKLLRNTGLFSVISVGYYCVPQSE